MFALHSQFKPSGDQPEAIKTLSSFIKKGSQYQTLIGVTGSGKTFSMAHIIQELQMPTLIMTHNKTLAAQLYSEFKGFFPKNHVEYFISHFDYYQPEAYIPRQDLFIEKDSSINEGLERLRLSATTSLLAYDDCVVVASVSANYGLGNPKEYLEMIEKFEVAQDYHQKSLLLRLVDMGYKRNDNFFDRGDFRVNGEVIDIFPAYSEEEIVRLEFFGDELESITLLDSIEKKPLKKLESFVLYAANPFIVGADRLKQAVKSIEEELHLRLKFFKEQGRMVEYERLKSRTEFDLEMIQATGICKGIENYARHLTGKKPGETPYSLLDYFAQKNQPYLLIVDESHVSLPQFGGMYAGDRSRKEVLVEYGFRLPSALDNRPLKYEEFIIKAPHFLFVSATPAQKELDLSQEHTAEQLIRPTGLLDPLYEVLEVDKQVTILYDRAKEVIARGERVLVTALTKKMAEELTKYYNDLGLRVRYMHSDIDAIERNQIIRALRAGEFDILVGINLLREGLDLPEVSLVAILDADKEGFLRSETSLIQTMGRAARNVNGRVLLFASKITPSMQKAMEITDYRRAKQEAYNKAHNIIPQSVSRKLDEDLKNQDLGMLYERAKKASKEKMPKSEREKLVKELSKQMQEAAKKLEFEEAARLRDEIAKLRAL
ncbi:excinuclease ABC subunit B [Helicobacter winghamensis]|uniref:UvrABC system protein B n=2 Tax=Helicobacter winghamensis TaxID=157268 RepID=A0A2N3PKX8_9HELI|nr:excinuclease ABC subunit UvrB [Helicobacter winghamensis]PKT79113.1 excinuclease ABC subunit B [Helicobacter winghamensis]PKT79176.1 excinuclease ABC subunit B [Helicobacter winghamensis]PKT79265.1 excinuclease ABC subunit B [Helicobacter winghamensis]PKT82330.1 excinuclease ABC subunit B [Helicobacter winghamensis]PKT82444.1 excinuclease ABC subunit B [Helicobacter winghamensis]